MNSLLEIRNISLTYQTLTDEITAIDNLSFNCNNGEFTSIIGPSGCGKTTVLSIISGLISPTKGQILLEGKQLDKDNKKSIGYMLQKDQLFPWRTVEKNLFLPLEIKKMKNEENSVGFAK